MHSGRIPGENPQKSQNEPPRELPDGLQRYQRQIVMPALGLDGQRRIMAGRALIIGLGGLGSWVAELLTRAGVGNLRLVDDDLVEIANIHRQALYVESDAATRTPKTVAAARRLAHINSTVNIDPLVERADRFNLDRLCRDIDLIIDGTDNFETRFLINDYAVKHCRPWIFAGVIRTEAMVAAFQPGKTLCLRCLMDDRTTAEHDTATWSRQGVIGPTVAAIAAFEAAEALKLLSGNPDHLSPYLLRFDMWGNSLQRININRPDSGHTGCPCCDGRNFEFLEPQPSEP